VFLGRRVGTRDLLERYVSGRFPEQGPMDAKLAKMEKIKQLTSQRVWKKHLWTPNGSATIIFVN